MTTGQKTERQMLDDRIQDIEDRIASLEDRARELDREADDLREDLERLTRRYPPLPDVMTIKLPSGGTWYSDGWTAVRDAWPGDYQDREHGEGIPAGLEKMLAGWIETHAPATVSETIPDADFGEVVILSTGTRVRADRFKEITSGRTLTLDNLGPTSAVIFRDESGDVVAVQMPLNRV